MRMFFASNIRDKAPRTALAAALSAAVLAALTGCDKPPPPPAQQVIYVTNTVPVSPGAENSGVEAPATPESAVTEEPIASILEERQFYEDPDYGFRIGYPQGEWRRGGLGVTVASGEICRIWSALFAPTNQIMVVVRKEKAPVSIETLSWEMPREFSSSFQAAVEDKKILNIDGKRALSLRVSGNGTGTALAEQGPVVTTQRWIVIPRGVELISIIASGPAREFGFANKALEEMLTTLEIQPQRPPPSEAPKHYVDLEYGFRLPYPGEGWVRGGAPPGGVYVPGELCRAWSSVSNPDQLIAVFVQRTGFSQTPLELLEGSVQMAVEVFGAAVIERVITPIGGMNAASITISGPGTGSAIDGTGPIKTAQHWVFIPRREDVVALLASGPAVDFSEVDVTFIKMLAELEAHGFQTPEQKQSRARQARAASPAP